MADVEALDEICYRECIKNKSCASRSENSHTRRVQEYPCCKGSHCQPYSRCAARQSVWKSADGGVENEGTILRLAEYFLIAYAAFGWLPGKRRSGGLYEHDQTRYEERERTMFYLLQSAWDASDYSCYR